MDGKSKKHNMAVVKASKGGKKKPSSGGKGHKVKHVMIKPNDDGTFSSETHMMPQSKDEMADPYGMQPYTASHATQDDAANHVGGMDMNNFQPPADGESGGEPDGDEGAAPEQE